MPVDLKLAKYYLVKINKTARNEVGGGNLNAKK